MIEKRALATGSIGLLTIVSIFILFTILLASAGLYFYKGITAKNIKKMESDLNLAKNRFEPSKITELQVLDRRLRASSEILSGHIAVTPIFQALQAITLKTVQYTQFTYNLGTSENKKITVKMKGLAVGYRSIALQSDLFTTKDIGKNLIDPVFSNLALDNNGNVLFDLEFLVDPSFVDYKIMLETAN